MKYNPREYIAWWLHQKKIVVDERGALISPDKRDQHELFDTMFLDYTQSVSEFNFVAEKKVKVASDKLMQRALDEFVSMEILRRRNETVAKLTCTTEDLAPIEQWTKAVTGRSDKKIAAVIAHFIWMIKRRLFDKEVVYHIMPIIYGKQGAGKSIAVEKLISPLANLTLRIRVTEVADQRFFQSFSRNFVIFLDEMAGASKTDVEVLKNQITASYNDFRKLSTNVVLKIKQNCSLIGCTNRPINELIYDATGARRFYEINSLGIIDWGTINNIDYLALFKGVDEKLERGYIEPHLLEIGQDQQSLVGIDNLDIFIDEHGLNSEEDPKEITTKSLYQIYRTWCESTGSKPLDSSWMTRKLGNKGLKALKRKVGSITERYFMVGKDSPVHRKSVMIESLKQPVKVWDQ
jgi:Virulence-associated protein E